MSQLWKQEPVFRLIKKTIHHGVPASKVGFHQSLAITASHSGIFNILVYTCSDLQSFVMEKEKELVLVNISISVMPGLKKFFNNL